MVNPYSSIRFTGDHRAFSLADAQTMYSPEMDRWSTGSNRSEKISALWRLEHRGISSSSTQLPYLSYLGTFTMICSKL